MSWRPSDAGPAVLATVGALLGAGAVLLSSPAVGVAQETSPPSAPELRWGGPHGLAVHESRGRVTVRWITERFAPGRLEVVAAGRRVARIRTDTAQAHSASFDLPDEADALLLRYGAAGSELHETRVRLPLDPPRAGAVFEPPDSVYVLGDVHGSYEPLRRLLDHVGLVDGEGRWTAGGAHLVFLGDLVDRGPDVTRTLWWIYGLEPKARRAGGRVHVVLGNHELMVMTGDLRYVHGREREIARAHGVPYTELFDVRSSVLARWLASKPPVLALGDLLLAHGGVSPAYADWSVEAFDDSLAAYVDEPLFARLADSTVVVPPMDSAAVARRLDFFFGSENPFWYRGWFPPDSYRETPAGGGGAAGSGARTDTAAGSEEEARAETAARARAAADSVTARLEAVLDRYGASRHVLGHTPYERVGSLHGGKVLATDLREPATELLLLVRGGEGWRALRWGLEGGPEPVEPLGPSSEEGGG